MNIYMKLFVCLTVLVGPALAQIPAFKRPPTSPAFVYVSRPTEIEGFGASSSGELTPVVGSPYPNISVTHLSANGNFLFGTDASGKYVYSFSIFFNGGLQQVAKTDVSKYISNPCCGLGLQIDPSGSDLYVGVTDYVNGEEYTYLESFKIDELTGELQYLGKSLVNPHTISELRFVPSTHYAYQTGCWTQVNGGTKTEAPVTSEFRRESNGFLTFLGTTDEVPKAEGADKYCPFALASDPTESSRLCLPDVGYRYGHRELYGERRREIDDQKQLRKHAGLPGLSAYCEHFPNRESARCRRRIRVSALSFQRKRAGYKVLPGYCCGR